MADLDHLDYRHALSNDKMLQCSVQTMLSQPSREGKKPKTLVVSKHRDLETFRTEFRADKNRWLVDMLKQTLKEQLFYYHLGSEVIFQLTADSSLNFHCCTRLFMVCPSDILCPRTNYSHKTNHSLVIDQPYARTKLLTSTTHNFCLEFTAPATCNCSICFCF